MKTLCWLAISTWLLRIKTLKFLWISFGLECLIKKPTCFQPKNPSCIDLILTNKKDLFKNSNVLEVGINSLSITALKSQLVKGNAKTKLYRDYSEFNKDNFKAELDDKLKSGVVTEYSNFKTFLFKFSIIILRQIKKLCVSIMVLWWLKP